MKQLFLLVALLMRSAAIGFTQKTISAKLPGVGRFVVKFHLMEYDSTGGIATELEAQVDSIRYDSKPSGLRMNCDFSIANQDGTSSPCGKLSFVLTGRDWKSTNPWPEEVKNLPSGAMEITYYRNAKPGQLRYTVWAVTPGGMHYLFLTEEVPAPVAKR